uniref:Discs, large (Drosophila) homolog-associated protein 5 n=1 Tax=Amphilophus citrinellus TaxID=61819 RepID=A0A3Q0R267_AMPCI
MESRFAHLRERDTSVSMLRVKMSRRRSQSQKENRERTVNTRRQLDKLPELEMSSLDASMAMANISTIQDKTQNNAKPAKSIALFSLHSSKAVEERIKQLERWKERKALEKEKEKRERDRKGVFKIGLYHPQNMIASLPAVPDASTRVKEVRRDLSKEHFTLFIVKHVCESHRFQPFFFFFFFFFFLVPAVRALPTRSANRPPGPAVKDKPKDNALTEPEMQEVEKKPSSPSPTRCSQEEEMVVDHAPAQSVPAEPASSSFSFAPEGFVFQAPNGLSSFKFEPLTPRSADAFLTPSSSFNLPPAPVFGDEQSESSPPKSPLRTSPTIVPPTPGEAVETKHDVPYFRSEIANETHRLTTLCLHWESKVEDECIPEEMRDRMRTAVGQARLLMKERFNQFSGLVDDCELGRGDKITTCTDLQGFWDMVYYQVEDVNKKFDALKEAEGRSWVEEHKPPPRQKKVVKKPSAVPAKPAGTNAAAKARLAAAKAAMKAKKQAAEAEKAASAADSEGGLVLSSQQPQPQARAQKQDTVVFDGGFFQVESPAKPSGGLHAKNLVFNEIHGLDFERYFQPSDRCSLSPRDAAATERLSHMAVDVEMESPRSQPVDLLTQPESGKTNVLAGFLFFFIQTVESAMLLFTPDLKDKIRQSVCPSDLMVFTPPNM